MKGANVNYSSSYGRTPMMVAVVANRTEIIDHLLEKDANIDTLDINGDTALTIAKRFNNKLGQYRLTQYKWKKRTEAELKHRKQSEQNNNDDIFGDKRLPHQVFDSSKKTWLKGDFMQIYMMQLAPYSEFSGNSLSAPKSVGRKVILEHREHRSLSELRIGGSNELDESSGGADGTRGLDSPTQSGITFDKWLNQKLKAKRIEKDKNKKIERAQSIDK